MFTQAELSDFGELVAELVKKEQLIKGLFQFLELAKENNIEIVTKIVFIGEYQRLLFESVILNISYILKDKNEETDKSMMQDKLDEAVDKLKKEIKNNQGEINYTIEQKEKTLKEIEAIRESKEYKEAIKALHNIRNVFIAHRDKKIERDTLTYKQLTLVIDNIKRCYNLWNLAVHRIVENRITSLYDTDYKNIIEALIIQEELCSMRDKYNHKYFGTDKFYKWYNSPLDFFREQIKQAYETETSTTI